MLPRDDWETRKQLNEKTKALRKKVKEIKENSIKEVNKSFFFFLNLDFWKIDRSCKRATKQKSRD